MERRRMDKQIDGLRDHVIVCGWGRVGRAIAKELGDARRAIVIVDNDPERVATIARPALRAGGRDERRRAAPAPASSSGRALVAALSTDADEPVHHPLRPGAPTGSVHRCSRPRGLEHREAHPGRGRPGGQPAGDRRCPDRRVPAAAARHRVPGRGDPRPQHRAAPRGGRGAAGSPFVGQSLRQAHVRDQHRSARPRRCVRWTGPCSRTPTRTPSWWSGRSSSPSGPTTSSGAWSPPRRTPGAEMRTRGSRHPRRRPQGLSRARPDAEPRRARRARASAAASGPAVGGSGSSWEPDDPEDPAFARLSSFPTSSPSWSTDPVSASFSVRATSVVCSLTAGSGRSRPPAHRAPPRQ